MLYRLKFLLLIILGPLFLASCADEHQDLDGWLKEIQSKPVPSVQPIPDVKPYVSFEYAAQDMPSPFEKKVPEATGSLTELQGCGVNDPKPDLNRRKEELEKMPLNTLTMVGAISTGDGEIQAIIRDESSGLLYQIQKDNYLGLNNGKVTDLSESIIKLYEVVPNGRGCWESRTQTLELGQ
jgi:type IV pilus assembly protein PilP